MATKNKKKRLTNKEKTFRAQLKKDLQGKGILPPDKPRLNRKKFAKETIEEFEKVCGDFDGLMELWEALGWFVSKNPNKVTSEQVGIYKLMKVAIETKKFRNRMREAGKDEYNLQELCDVISPIVRL